MPTDVTFVIPIAPYHTDIADRAIESAQMQTVPSTVIYIHDRDGNGPAWARNRGMERVKTPFVVFLDADDWVEPNFVERCMDMYQTGQYVYTDWVRDDGQIVTAYEEPWCEDLQWHPITALLPTYAVQQVGGFETMPGGEDTEFYWALTRSIKCCGIVLHEPLFHYSKGGQRSITWLDLKDGQGPQDFSQNERYIEHMAMLNRRYGRMGCCRDKVITATTSALPEGEGMLARATWGGNKVVTGIATGIKYPRTGNGALLRVHPADLAAMPQDFRPVEEPKPQPAKEADPRPKVTKAQGFNEVVSALFGIGEPPPTLEQLEAVERVAIEPDVSGIVALARRHYGQ